MPLCELESLAVRSCCKLLVDNLDVKDILPYLCLTGDVDEDTAIEIQETRCRRTNTMRFLLNNVKNCSFENLLTSLQEDYIFLADKLRHNLNVAVRIYIDSVSPSEAVVHAVHSSRCFKVLKLFNSIHHEYENGNISTFWSQFRKVEMLWQSREKFSEKVTKQTSDLYFMLLGLQYRHKAEKGDFSVHDKMLQKFQKVLPHTSDECSSTIIMLNNRARMLSTYNAIPEAQNAAIGALAMSASFQNGVEVIESHITCSTVELFETVDDRTDEKKKKQVALIMKIRDMIQDLEGDAREDYRETEASTYTMAGLTLLNIAEDGKEIGADTPTLGDVYQAKSCFSHIETNKNLWDTLSNNWKAVIYLGKSKLALLGNNFDKAKGFIKYAEFCAERVDYMPNLKENISQFKEKNIPLESTRNHELYDTFRDIVKIKEFDSYNHGESNASFNGGDMTDVCKVIYWKSFCQGQKGSFTTKKVSSRKEHYKSPRIHRRPTASHKCAYKKNNKNRWSYNKNRWRNNTKCRGNACSPERSKDETSNLHHFTTNEIPSYNRISQRQLHVKRLQNGRDFV